jgi:hypothetical protein
MDGDHIDSNPLLAVADPLTYDFADVCDELDVQSSDLPAAAVSVDCRA